MSPNPQDAQTGTNGDILAFPTGTLVPSPPPDPTVTASPTDPTATRTAAAAAAARGGLSTNTKTIVGIAIAIGLLVLLGVGLGAWFYLRRRRRRTHERGPGGVVGLMRERSSTPVKPISPGDGDGEANWVPQIDRPDGGYGTEVRAYSSLAHDQQSEGMPSVEYHYGMRRDVGRGGGYGTGGLGADGEEDEGGLPGYGKSRALDAAEGGEGRSGGARGMYQRYEAMGDEKMLIPDRGDGDEREGGGRGGGGGVV